MTYRQIAHIARCSAGAVGAEMRAWKAEKAMEEKMKKEAEDALPKLDPDHTFTSSSNGEGDFQDRSFDFSQDMPTIEIELESQ